ncbi:TonB-dependent receptor [Pelomonas sp. KK5]|uniref:TonB-dependent receptor n=1 Tax=Pelomonas sp. KK5 TaxID=1855730 RepID=UPI00097C47F3|nr:TonB-dependent receptor [Pelomonas sp. KK5]
MFKRTQVCAGVLAVLGGMSTAAIAQQQLERVEITGSSIKRIDAETSVPVTVITRDAIDKSGASNVQELVDRLSSNNGGGVSLAQSIGDASANGQSGASLRGLGRERTLVLLNGRRLSPYPFSGAGVDMNAIPLSAVDHVEVLRDGASATYGSDAIGGVINFITRKDMTGGNINVSYEKPQHKGGTVKSVGGGIGFGDLARDKVNVLGSFSYQKYDVIHASDRDFAQTGNRPDIGVVKTSGNTFPANATIPGGAYIPGVAGFPNCAPPDSFNDGSSSNCRYDYTHYVDIVPASKRLGAFTRATAQVAPDHQLFGEVVYSKNEILLGSSQTPSTTTGRAPYVYPAGGKYYPTAAVHAVDPTYNGDLRISWRIVDGGQRLTKVTNDMTRFMVGMEGTLAGWDYKTALSQTKANAREDFVSGNYSDTELVRVLKTGNVNPFGPNDAAGLALLHEAELSGNNRKSNTKNDAFDISASRELFAMSGGNAAVAFGLDLRRETYLDGYSDLAGSGDIVGGSGNAGKVSAKRQTQGLYAELNLPVIKTVELNAAVRTDRYTNTSGESRDGAFSSPNLSSTSPKFGLKWTPTKEILVRGSVGKGFRAPGLNDLYAPAAGTNTGGSFDDPFYNDINKTSTKNGCAALPNTDHCNTQLTAINHSNANLKPEKSKTATLGFVFEPMKDLSLEIDYFSIKVTDGIKTLSGDDILKDWYKNQTGPTTSSSVFANRLVKDPATGYLDHVDASLENIGSFKAAGFDLAAKYRVRTAMGTFTPAWDATITTKSSETNVVSGVVEDTLGKYHLGGPVVRVKQNFILDWDGGSWGATVRYYRQSGYQDYDEVSHVKAYDLWNLQGQYKGVKNLILTVGVENLFDKKPSTSVQEDYFQVGYDPTYADVKGRSYYVRATYKF